MPETLKRGKRRGEVFETAGRVFFAKGYEAASIQDIADELGMLKGSLYYYISTKEDLLAEIVQSYHDETRAYFEQILASNEPVVSKLRRFIETETAHTAHHIVKSSLFFTEWRSVSPERQAAIVAERDRHDHFVQDCIIQAQRLGAFRADVDPRIASYGVLGMVNSVYRWYRADGPNTAEEIGHEFAELLIRGLTVAQD
jgi:AcrR family transcriptional regulator